MQVVSFTELRKNLKTIIDTSTDQHEPVIITRPQGEHMVMMPLTSYESLKETAYLLSEPANAEHLRKSLDNLRAGKVIEKKLIDD